MIHVKSWQQTQLLLCNYRDAAHRLHPLAGQGVNLGFGDVSCLSQVLNEAVQSGSDVGSLYYLSKYETERQRAVLPVVMTIHGLHHLYNTDFSPVVLLRSLGLQSTNALQFVKVGSTSFILFYLYIHAFICLSGYVDHLSPISKWQPFYCFFLEIESFIIYDILWNHFYPWGSMFLGSHNFLVHGDVILLVV